MGIFSEIFSWWGGNTWSNRIYTALRGKLVGTDAAGNRYYVQSKGVGPLGVPRRWVIYKNLAEASQVPPEWHGWMHYMVDSRRPQEDYMPRPWQKPHRMNMTGTPEAYRPPGSILAQRQAARGDRRLQALAAALRAAPSRWRHVSRSTSSVREAAGTVQDSSIGHGGRQTATVQMNASGSWRAAVGAACALVLLSAVPARPSASRTRLPSSPRSTR